jgi:serine/threonine protein kinase
MLDKCLVDFFCYKFLDAELGEIGEGAFAKVYLVERKSDKRKLALKKNSKELKSKDNYFANKLKNHKLSNVVEIYDVDNSSIIMELCNNGPLSDFIGLQVSKKLPLDESVFFFLHFYIFIFHVCLSLFS